MPRVAVLEVLEVWYNALGFSNAVRFKEVFELLVINKFLTFIYGVSVAGSGFFLLSVHAEVQEVLDCSRFALERLVHAWYHLA
jgi:hypothetical protein